MLVSLSGSSQPIPVHSLDAKAQGFTEMTRAPMDTVGGLVIF